MHKSVGNYNTTIYLFEYEFIYASIFETSKNVVSFFSSKLKLCAMLINVSGWQEM